MGVEGPAPHARLGLTVLSGVLGGVVGGFFGVGGGIVLVPLGLWLLRLDQHRAHATSLAAITAIAFAGTMRFALAGAIDWGVGVALGVGGVLGSTVGARLMHRLSPRALQGLFAVVLIVAGIRMVL